MPKSLGGKQTAISSKMKTELLKALDDGDESLYRFWMKVIKGSRKGEKGKGHLPKVSKKELIEWCMKEGLIASSSECPKCNERMGLYKRKSAVFDGFEWRCRKKGVNTHDVRNRTNHAKAHPPGVAAGSSGHCAPERVIHVR
ncbi:uncharacterized protein TNCV_141621 [Trichonephila clavipes]|nr:uncharacterized protein TNCV_141621 [Trichonephila clavipes]